MLVPCEIAVKCVAPVIRALVAKELMQNYNLKQSDVAKLLGTTQATVSNYMRKVRGKAIDVGEDEEILASVKEIARLLSLHEAFPRKFISKFCYICTAIRRKGYMCKLHKRLEIGASLEECDICLRKGRHP